MGDKMTDPMNWGFCMSEYDEKTCDDCLSQKECLQMIREGKIKETAKSSG